jgi:3-phosphoshikimate 1-carboxyvinyltransferase
VEQGRVTGETKVRKVHIAPGSVQETLVIPLYGRKVCSERFGSLYADRSAAELCERLDYDFSGQPDLAQTFVVCCCMMGVPFRFAGLSTLRIKETDRIQALQTELAKMGYNIEVVDDCTLEWKGEVGEAAPQFSIDTYHDHRMAMSFAPASLRLPFISINDPQVVSKSYPAFWQHLLEAGFTIEEG